MRRKELHIKQAELAETLEISNNHMSSIENGRQKPSLDTFIRLCDCLNVTPDYLLLGSMHAYNLPQDILDNLNFQPEIALKASQAEKLHVIGTLNLCFSHTHIMFFRKFKSCL